MRKRGEITVFLSLVIVSIMSLLLGLLESARTTGARLYGQMAADSAMASVMSQYNRNLWEMYHLLFLEAESEEAVEQSFSSYLNFYLEQENLYPMKLDEVKIIGMTGMMEDGGAWLEDGALSYVTYRLPDVANDLVGIAEDAANASKVGDFQELFEVCRQTGKMTRTLEKRRMEAEECLADIRALYLELMDAAESEARGGVERLAEEIVREQRGFFRAVDEYEAEILMISEHREELKTKLQEELRVETSLENALGGLVEAQKKEGDTLWNTDASAANHMEQEVMAYEAVEEAAKKQLLRYRETKEQLEQNEEILDEALTKLEEEQYESVYVEVEVNGEADGEVTENGYGTAEGENQKDGLTLVEELVPIGPDWDAVGSILSQIEIPSANAEGSIDFEKASALDRLEELFQGDLLSLILPVGTEVSRKSVVLRGIPSKNEARTREFSENVLDKILVNEYCFLKFDSFVERSVRNTEIDGQPLSYEQEYLLCGEASDRENLSEAVERLLAVRGAMNILYLLSSPERKAEADTLALGVSGGNASVMFIVSFFILTLWAFGEAICDVKQLMNGGRVPFMKLDHQWELELEELLAFQFMDTVPSKGEEGKDYTDHMRILFFLMNRQERNFRMMDVIQWNVRTVQEDFSVADCYCEVEIDADIYEKHLFLMSGEYTRSLQTVGVY